MNSMEILTYNTELSPDPDSVVTVGTYDGVHLGHQSVLRYVVDRAHVRSGKSTVLTFDPHPREIVANAPTPLLTTVSERAEICAKLGIARFIVIPFTRQFAATEAEEFVRSVLVGRVGLGEIIVGPDHFFGSGRSGDGALLRSLGSELGYSVDVLPERVVNEQKVSSSRIRQLIEESGEMQSAARLLGHPYTLSAKVVRGAGRGRSIGFPTANLQPVHERKIIPAVGVYAVRVFRPDSMDSYAGMMNIGYRPTFDGKALSLEVHLLEFEGDLYGSELRLEFVERLREERKFEDVDALVAQLKNDKARCTAALEQYLLP